MGLTIHFILKVTSPTCGPAEAKKLVESMHRVAQEFFIEGRVDRVWPVTADDKTLRRNATDWLMVKVPGEIKTTIGVEIAPAEGFLFPVSVGKDCEPLWLGLCRYPVKVFQGGKEYTIRRRAPWRLARFSKTQYASLHGWEHFRRCHCAIIDLLNELQSPALRVEIRDEGEYWPRRSEKALRRNLDQMNGLIAAAAGAMKDADPTVQSPIFRHKQYERLEAEGEAKKGAAIRQAQKVISRLLS